MKKQRWQERRESFGKALSQLRGALKKKRYSQLERAGLIKTFELAWELAWKSLQDYLRYEGYETAGPRDVLKQALKNQLLRAEDPWMDLLEARNLMVHIYDQEQSQSIIKLIRKKYAAMLMSLNQNLLEKS